MKLLNLLLVSLVGIFLFGLFYPSTAQADTCSQPHNDASCSANAAAGSLSCTRNNAGRNVTTFCCPPNQIKVNGSCQIQIQQIDSEQQNPLPPINQEGPAGNLPANLEFDPRLAGPDDGNFNAVNPLVQFAEEPSQFLNPDGSLNPGLVINRALIFLFPIAGFVLFIMFVWGGFDMLARASTKKSIEAGRNRAVAALIGFGLLFASYWIIQVVELIFGVRILG